MKKTKKFLLLFVCLFVIPICLSGCDFFNGQNSNNNSQNAYYDNSLMQPRLIDVVSGSNAVEVAKNVAPAVVGITSAIGGSYSIGTGVAVKAGGYILTNSHVITNDNNIKLYLANGNTTTASLTWRDRGLDLAVLKSKMELPYLEMVENNGYSIGEDVIAIGTPLSLQFRHTITKGIISALNRTLTVDGENGSTLQSLIQHDASINPGNSGGPLINMQGQLIGINTLKVESAEGLGFAIPVGTALPVVNEISATGQYKSSYIGLFGYDASIGAFEGKVNVKRGIYVENIAQNSPLEKAGLKKGDVIVAINNVDVNNMLELRTLLFKQRVADKIEINYISQGFEKTVKITLQEKPLL